MTITARGKSIGIFLIDDDVDGRVKGTLANWTGLAFKIPRTSLELCKSRPELKQSGVYFLFGKNDRTDKEVVYVGQAGLRQNGEGILNRLFEHNRNPEKDYWTEAIALTTSNDSLGPTEISYLEYRFCQMAVNAKRYEVKNGNTPNPGNPSEEKQSELEEFIDYAKVLVGVLGHKVFVSITGGSDPVQKPMLFCTRAHCDARGRQTSDGFVVLSGSRISTTPSASCPDQAYKKRETYKEYIDSEGILHTDILFNTPSGASSFVCASSSSGYVDWKDASGKTLKELERAE